VSNDSPEASAIDVWHTCIHTCALIKSFQLSSTSTIRLFIAGRTSGQFYAKSSNDDTDRSGITHDYIADPKYKNALITRLITISQQQQTPLNQLWYLYPQTRGTMRFTLFTVFAFASLGLATVGTISFIDMTQSNSMTDSCRRNLQA
jgi:hypothetical protein